jgi:hypothetical protein
VTHRTPAFVCRGGSGEVELGLAYVLKQLLLGLPAKGRLPVPGKKEGRKEGYQGRKEGRISRKEGRKEGRKEERKEGRKEGTSEIKE